MLPYPGDELVGPPMTDEMMSLRALIEKEELGLDHLEGRTPAALLRPSRSTGASSRSWPRACQLIIRTKRSREN